MNVLSKRIWLYCRKTSVQEQLIKMTLMGRKEKVNYSPLQSKNLSAENDEICKARNFNHPCLPELSAYPMLKVPEWSQWQDISGLFIQEVFTDANPGGSVSSTQWEQCIRNKSQAETIPPPLLWYWPWLGSCRKSFQCNLSSLTLLLFRIYISSLPPQKPFMYLTKMYCVLLFIYLFCMCAMGHMWRTEKNCGDQFFLPSESQVSDFGHYSWQWMPLSTEPSHQLTTFCCI